MSLNHDTIAFDIWFTVETNRDLCADGWRCSDNEAVFSESRALALTDQFEADVIEALRVTRDVDLTQHASDRLSRIVERLAGHCISRGAVIVAALVSGHHTVRALNSRDCRFVRSRPRIQEAA